MKTTSYEISKKLKEAGYVGKTDLETILDALPKHINQDERQFLRITFLNFASLHYREWDCDYMEWVISNSCEIIQEENESLADTAGKMWLMLKEKGMV